MSNDTLLAVAVGFFGTLVARAIAAAVAHWCRGFLIVGFR